MLTFSSPSPSREAAVLSMRIWKIADNEEINELFKAASDTVAFGSEIGTKVSLKGETMFNLIKPI